MDLFGLKAVVACGLVVACSACGGGNNNALTGPTPTAVLEVFSGTVDAGGRSFHPFHVNSPGTVNVTLTQATPPITIFMGLGVGSVSGDQCVPAVGASVQTQAGPVAQIFGAAGVGDYCVVVFDVGNQTAAVDYSVTVSHF